MHHHTKFHQNRLNETAVEILHIKFLKMAAVRHFGFVGQILGQPATRIWWCLSLCKIWLESH